MDLVKRKGRQYCQRPLWVRKRVCRAGYPKLADRRGATVDMWPTRLGKVEGLCARQRDSWLSRKLSKGISCTSYKAQEARGKLSGGATLLGQRKGGIRQKKTALALKGEEEVLPESS